MIGQTKSIGRPGAKGANKKADMFIWEYQGSDQDTRFAVQDPKDSKHNMPFLYADQPTLDQFPAGKSLPINTQDFTGKDLIIWYDFEVEASIIATNNDVEVTIFFAYTRVISGSQTVRNFFANDVNIGQSGSQSFTGSNYLFHPEPTQGIFSESNEVEGLYFVATCGAGFNDTETLLSVDLTVKMIPSSI